jgi:hypothetical protein
MMKKAEKPPMPVWYDTLTQLLSDNGMKSADLKEALGNPAMVTVKAIQKYIDSTEAHWRVALEALVLSAKGLPEEAA